jgi:hypothetical protein
MRPKKVTPGWRLTTPNAVRLQGCDRLRLGQDRRPDRRRPRDRRADGSTIRLRPAPVGRAPPATAGGTRPHPAGLSEYGAVWGSRSGSLIATSACSGSRSPNALARSTARPACPWAHRCLLPIGRACGPLSPPLGNRGGSGRLGPFEPPGTQGAHAARSSPNDSLQIRRWFSVSHLVRMLLLDGGAKGTRTPDLLVANETRYRLRHSPATGWADQHRDFTTVTRKQTSAFPGQRSRSRSPTPRPEHPQ